MQYILEDVAYDKISMFSWINSFLYTNNLGVSVNMAIIVVTRSFVAPIGQQYWSDISGQIYVWLSSVVSKE